MRRALPILVLPLFLVACAPAKDTDVTRQVLANAQIARTAVSDLTMRYGEMLRVAGSSPDAPSGGWEAVAPFRESAEGAAVRQFLSEYSKPVAVDPSFARAREIEELTRATAALVSFALEPRGTWGTFSQEVTSLRSRVDRALSSLEKGTKTFILIEARTKTEEKAMAYSNALAAARAAEARKKKEAPALP